MHARLAAERATPRACKNCGETWLAFPKDKSVFCSWACHAADKGHLETKEVECFHCGEAFQAQGARIGSGRGKFCSKSCAYEHAKNRMDAICDNCGILFETTRRRPARFCTKRCDVAYTFGRRSPSWKGGKHISNRGHVVVTVGRRKQMAEHRMIASIELRRPLLPREIVIHVDHDKTNNSPENLWIGSKEEWTRIQFGAEQWPNRSNLYQYGKQQ